MPGSGVLANGRDEDTSLRIYGEVELKLGVAGDGEAQLVAGPDYVAVVCYGDGDERLRGGVAQPEGVVAEVRQRVVEVHRRLVHRDRNDERVWLQDDGLAIGAHAARLPGIARLREGDQPQQVLDVFFRQAECPGLPRGRVRVAQVDAEALRVAQGVIEREATAVEFVLHRVGKVARFQRVGKGRRLG